MNESKRCNDLMCDENIRTKADAKKWLLKNHPDKLGSSASDFDVSRFTNVKQCIDNKNFCKTKRKPKAKKNKTRRNSGSGSGSGSNASNSGAKSEDKETKQEKMFKCVRKRANWSNIKRHHTFDSDKFDLNEVNLDVASAAPKVNQMLNTIAQLDKIDKEKHGKVFKHFIYSDVKDGGYGAKILASAFESSGYTNLIRAREVENRKSKQLYLKQTIHPDEKGKCFAILSSSALYRSSYTQKLKKNVLSMFNARPDNVHGNNMRFIILDSGFKEGIDLFDVKYVHIFEPSLTVADLKQTIGRATRTCGQKGLHFQDGVGWELFVYNYFLTVPEVLGDAYKINTTLTRSGTGKPFKDKATIKQVLSEFSSDNPLEQTLSEQLYNLAYPLSVDFDLTGAIHGEVGPEQRYTLFSNDSDSSSSSSTKSPKLLALMYGGARGKGKGKGRSKGLIKIETITCNGRCGKRSTKDVPASVDFLEKVYKKYGFDKVNGAVPKKGKREFLCGVMKKSANYCDYLNKEWAMRMAKVPFSTTEADVEDLVLVPEEPSDKVDYHVFEDLPKVDKKEQEMAIVLYEKSKQTTTPVALNSPSRKMGYKEMRRHINTYFSQFKYPEMKIVNKCKEKPPAREGENSDLRKIVDYTPSQNFVSHFFTPQSAYKGMLLWHSVGTGKTCSAIATSSATFENEGYTILWVTRTTLKSDVYKNIFDMVCHQRIANMIKSGKKIPEELSGRTRLINQNWIKPMSYKQFSNLLLKNNEFYNTLVEKNGEDDVLRKTLVIIDEAHKLYGGDLKAAERPDTDILEELIHQSYRVSGKDSVKLLIMTATPFTDSPMELFKLLNLMIDEPSKQFPTDIDSFQKKYMRDDGIISESGMKKLADQMAGYVSYLDRSKDASQFAQPIMIDVPVMMTTIRDPRMRELLAENARPNVPDKSLEKSRLRDKIKTLKARLKEKKKNHAETLKKIKKDCKEQFPKPKEKPQRDACYEEHAEEENERYAEDIKEDNEKLSTSEKEMDKIESDTMKHKELKYYYKMLKKNAMDQEFHMVSRCDLNKV